MKTEREEKMKQKRFPMRLSFSFAEATTSLCVDLIHADHRKVRAPQPSKFTNTKFEKRKPHSNGKHKSKRRKPKQQKKKNPQGFALNRSNTHPLVVLRSSHFLSLPILTIIEGTEGHSFQARPSI
jgi:hypothetical protein